MPRGKANESNKAKKSSNQQSNTKRINQSKKKSDAAAGKSESKTGEKIAAGETKDGGSGAAASKKVSPATARMLKRIVEWERPEKLELLRAWARDGLSMDQIAHNMGFKRRDTLYKYANLSADIIDSLRKGKEESNSEVENTLEDVTQNETQNNKGRNMKEKIGYIKSKVRKLIKVQERMKQR